MTARQFALQVAAIGGQQVWHAALVTLLWVVLAAALVTVLWGIGWPGRWLRERHENRKPVTHLVLGALPGDDGDPRAPRATIAAVCPCCNAWSNDCICTADCGAPRCQMAEIELPDWLPGDHRG